MVRFPSLVGVGIFLIIQSQPCLASDASIEKSGVAEIFARRCLSCHNNADQQGGFSLQTNDAFSKAEVVIPKEPDSSYLLDMIRSTDGSRPAMPKDADPLSAAEVNIIKDWIRSGAKWENGFEVQEPVIDNFDWWSFQPLKRPTVPELPKGTTASWQQNPIDAFILAKQKAEGISHSPEADKRILIRRLTYDLTGLPPTPEEIDRFLNDNSADAYQQLVERLLDSPAYGERWARHWLDVVKYADTCGYDKDKLRQNAWPYRDYVIRSFDEDKPYSRFIEEQIAGDALFPGEPDGILGLGFIAAGPWDFIGHVEVPEAKLDGKVARNLDRDDMVSNTLNTFCSVTIQCARCHNHKFDPFTQEHYYSLQSIFAAVDRAERPYDLDPAIQQKKTELNRQLAEVTTQQKQLEQLIQSEGGEVLEQLQTEIAALKKSVQPAMKEPQFGYHSQISKTENSEKWVQIDLGKVVGVKEIILHPCHDDYAGIGAGFGFPVQYRITGDLSASSPNYVSASILIADETREEFRNPGLAPVSYQLNGEELRYVRVTATQLAERKNDFIFALAEIEVIDSSGENVALNAKVAALDSIEAPVRWAKKNVNDGIWVKASRPQDAERLTLAQTELQRLLKTVETPERVQKRKELEKRESALTEHLKKLPEGKMVYAAATHFQPQGNFRPTEGKPRRIQLLHRGNIDQPREAVTPGVLPLASDSSWQLQLDDLHKESDRRAALAKWISSKDHPLTWRSIVNRVWLYHFGEALVASPNDFGRMGQLPSHSELLDWLAVEFRDNNESLKNLHRLIVNSATYKQSSDDNPENAEIDGSNRLLWRMNRRRLTAEEIRDSILAVSGQLDRTPYGPGDQLFVLEHPQHSPHYEYHLFDPRAAKRHRRSIYRFIVRSQPDPWMSVLDCADSSQSTPKRSETLTALQALSLMNNDFNLFMAECFAERLENEAVELSERIDNGFLLVTGRKPTTMEQESLQDHAATYGLTSTCRLLLNLNEFVFLD